MKNVTTTILCLIIASSVFAQEAVKTASGSEQGGTRKLPIAKKQSVVTTLQNSSAQAKLSLHDGTTLYCTIKAVSVPFTTDYGQTLKLNPTDIQTINFEKKTEHAVIRFNNDDQLTGMFGIKTITVQSLLGKLEISLATVKELSFTEKRNDSEMPGLVYWCTFDSIEAMQKPTAGPAGTYHSGFFVEGKTGKALQTDGAKLTMAVNLPAGSFNDKGCIEFWAKIKDPKRPILTQGCPTFFTAATSHGYMWLEYNVNNGHGMGGLCAVVAGKPFGLPMNDSGGSQSYSRILKTDPGGWHHYAIVWNDKGIKGISEKDEETPMCAVLLDGEVYALRKFDGRTDIFVKMADGPALLNIALPNSGDYRDFTFAIDELKIWNYDKTEFGISNDLATFHQYAD